MNRAERVERIIMGVIAQALRDARLSHITIDGDGAEASLLRSWCERAFGAGAVRPGGLVLHTANKTALVVGLVPQADALPFGDLYYSQVAELAGSAQLPAMSAELAEACGGAGALDCALEQLYDRRTNWDVATAHLPPAARTQLREALDTARFRRARVPLIPKVGGRTLGIDLYA